MLNGFYGFKVIVICFFDISYTIEFVLCVPHIIMSDATNNGFMKKLDVKVMETRLKIEFSHFE